MRRRLKLHWTSAKNVKDTKLIKITARKIRTILVIVCCEIVEDDGKIRFLDWRHPLFLDHPFEQIRPVPPSFALLRDDHL